MGRSIWKGSINFGLVNIPVQLETAVREKTVRFHMLSKDGSCRLRQKLFCPDTGKEFDFGETARGIEVSPEHYVLIDKKDIDKIKPERGQAIEIEQFVEMEEIDPIYFDGVYFVVPTGESLKAYKLLVEALKDQKRMGLARFVMREKQHLAAIRVLEDGLVLHKLHYADEVMAVADALPKGLAKAATPSAEVRMARQLIDQMTRPVHLKDFKDDYREQLESVIEQKKRGKRTVEISDEDDAEHIPHTINLMEALKKSLAGKGVNGHGGGHSAEHKRRKSA